MNTRNLVSGALILLMVGGLSYLGWRHEQTTPSKEGVVAVAASFYPLAEVARQVGGDFATVTTVVPATSEPQDK
jgi:ABC-type Zn uptake system ZnuABC Zn-binding protein ZnuA